MSDAPTPKALPPLSEVLAAANESASQSHFDIARRLRESYSGCHFTVCSDDEVSPRLTPVIESETAAVYFLSSNGHCLSFTEDPAAATGLLVAMRTED